MPIGSGTSATTGAAFHNFIIYSDLSILYSSFDLNNEEPNPADGGRGFDPAGPAEPFGPGYKLNGKGGRKKTESLPPCADPCINPNPTRPEAISCPGPAVEPQYYSYIQNPSIQRDPTEKQAQFGNAFAYDYSTSDSTERLSLDWIDDGQGNAIKRLFLMDDATGITYEYEDYANSSHFRGAKWRIIRSYFGPLDSPDWERRFIYDSLVGHGGMVESVDERGVRTFYDWTNYGTTQAPMWRITMISRDQPEGASWGSYDWSQLDVNLEYDTAGYLVAIVRKPRLVRHDVTNKFGNGSLNAQAEMIAPIKRFKYDSSYSLKRPLIAIYEDLDGGGTNPTFSDCRLLVSYTYDVQGDPFRVLSKNVWRDRTGAYATDTFAYPSAFVTTWTDPMGVVREYTWEHSGSTWTDPETSKVYSLRHLPGSRRITRYKVSDPGTIRQGYFHHSSKVTTFTYGSCGCGAPEVIVDPKGIKYAWTFDNATGNPLTLTVTGVGGSVSRTWTWTYEPNTAHYRIRNLLKSVTDPTGYTWTYDNAATAAGASLSIKSGSTTLYARETNVFGDPLWVEGESFSIEGSGSSKGRVEFVYGTSPAAVDYRLLKERKRVGGSPVIKEEFTYEGPGYLKTHKDSKGRITSITNNYNGQPVTVSLPVTQSGYVTGTGGTPSHGGQVELEYDLRGRVSVVRAKAYQKDGSAYAKPSVEQRFLYDGMGRLAYSKVDKGSLSSAGAQWSVTTYDYDPAGRPLAITETNGPITAFDIDGYGFPYRILEQVNGTQNKIRKYGFDENGNLLEVKRSPITGQPYTEQKVSFTLDPYGRTRKATYADGSIVERDFDKADRLEEVRLRDSTSLVVKSTFSYDLITKRLIQVLDTLTAGNKTRKKIYAYNGPLLSRVTDNDTARSKSFYYDGFGRTLRSVDSLLGSGSGNELIREYDIDDTVKTIIEKVIKDQGSSGNVTETYKKSYQYDAWGRLILAQDWGDLGQNPTAPLTESRFGRDSLGNLVWMKKPKASSSTDDSQVIDFGYDALGRILQQVIHPRKGSTLAPITLTTAYADNPGNGLAVTVSKTDGLGHLSEYDYDFGGRLTERRLPGYGSGAKTWTYSYDVEDRLLQWVDGNSATVKLGYDSLGRLDTRYLSSMGAQALSALCTNETFAYDSISARNQAKTFQYIWPDSQGPSPDANLLVQVDWTVDALGRKLSESFGFGDDPQHQPMVTKTFASSWGFGSNKEDFGFRRGLSTPNGFSLAFTPDNIGRLSQTSLNGNGLTNLGLAEYRFAGARPVNRIHRLWSGSNRFETKYSYNAQRFLSQVESKYGTGSPSDPTIFSQTLVRDLVGKILEDQQALANGSVGNKYSYDPFDRLEKAEIGVSTFGQNPTVAKTVQYALDVAQNRNSVTETVGSTSYTLDYQVAANSNQYDSVGGTAYTYDGNGNLISDGFYYYVYDYLDRLSEVYVITYQAGATSGSGSSKRTRIYTHAEQKQRKGKATKLSKAKASRLLATIRPRVKKELSRISKARSSKTASKHLKIAESVNQSLNSTVEEPSLEFVAWYGYDSYNRRVSKVSLYEDTWYGYDGWRMLEEYDAGWNATVSYFDGIGIDEHLGMASFDGVTWENYALVQDQIGNVRRVIDNTGSVIATFEYDPYGQRTLASGTLGFNIPYGFTGRYHDIETALIYFRNRYYSPTVGRFITRDRLGDWHDDSGRGNGYIYGGSNSISNADPLGDETNRIIVADSSFWRNPDRPDLTIARDIEGAKRNIELDPDGGRIAVIKDGKWIKDIVVPHNSKRLERLKRAARVKDRINARKNRGKPKSEHDNENWYRDQIEKYGVRGGKIYIDVMAPHGIEWTEADGRKGCRTDTPDPDATSEEVIRVIHFLKLFKDGCFFRYRVIGCHYGDKEEVNRKHNLATAIADQFGVIVDAFRGVTNVELGSDLAFDEHDTEKELKPAKVPPTRR